MTIHKSKEPRNEVIIYEGFMMEVYIKMQKTIINLV